MTSTHNTYDQVADQYVAMVQSRDESDFTEDPVATYFFDTIGDVNGLQVLDAGCGEGYVSRILSSQGATVTGIDICRPLVEIAQTKNPNNEICFHIHDLGEPLPQFENSFDLIASNMVLNDVPDYLSFIATICATLKSSGRAIFSLNNPYSAVPRSKVKNYFDSGTSILYRGMSEAGVKVYYYHRTLEEYITAFSDNGLLLKSLRDVQPTPQTRHTVHPKIHWNHFPYIMVLEFVKQ